MRRRDYSSGMISSMEQAYTQAVEKASASVVSIGSAKALRGPPFRPWWRRGIGAGVVLDGEGHILTNHHVIDDAQQLLVTFPDGTVNGGSVVGGDEETDVAVIRVESRGLTPADFADSDAVKLGQPVFALGNPLGLSGGPSVTSGIVSSLSRSLSFAANGQRMIQTDAAVNPGNSGGPLVNLGGQVVGILTAMIPHAEGIGFALPANAARSVGTELIAHGSIERPWLGVTALDAASPQAAYYGVHATSGVFVAEIAPGSPAERAGLLPGDVLVTLGGEPLSGVGGLVDSLRAKKVGDAIPLGVHRGGKSVTVRADLAPRP